MLLHFCCLISIELVLNCLDSLINWTLFLRYFASRIQAFDHVLRLDRLGRSRILLRGDRRALDHGSVLLQVAECFILAKRVPLWLTWLGFRDRFLATIEWAHYELRFWAIFRWSVRSAINIFLSYFILKQIRSTHLSQIILDHVGAI